MLQVRVHIIEIIEHLFICSAEQSLDSYFFVKSNCSLVEYQKLRMYYWDVHRRGLIWIIYMYYKESQMSQKFRIRVKAVILAQRKEQWVKLICCHVAWRFYTKNNSQLFFFSGSHELWSKKSSFLF